MLKLFQNDSIKDWKMKNIDTILSTFLTSYLKCNTKTHLLVSRQVKLLLLVTGKVVTPKQISSDFFKL